MHLKEIDIMLGLLITQDYIQDVKKSYPDWLIFLRELVTHPKKIGAAWPSSKSLADYIAKQVPLGESGYIVELGAGTGAITSALLKRGVPPEQLILIEQAPALANILKKTFPSIMVLEGNAANLGRLLGDEKAGIRTVVSSLPLQSLPAETVKGVLKQLNKLLNKGGTFIQFTYRLHVHAPYSPKYFMRRNSKIIWKNFPPARVCTLEHL